MSSKQGAADANVNKQGTAGANANKQGAAGANAAADKQSTTERKNTIWTPANIVTVTRILLVPVFVVAILAPWPAYFPQWPEAELAKPWISLAIFIILSATDGVDGYLARSRNEVTDFGKFVDPIADKILVAAALLALVELQALPSWVALIILVREFIISGVRMLAASKGRVIAASWYGKAKTVFQIIALSMFIIKDAMCVNGPQALAHPFYYASWFFMFVALVLTIVSMLDYCYKARDVIGLGPAPDDSESATSGSVDAARAADATQAAEADGVDEADEADAACAANVLVEGVEVPRLVFDVVSKLKAQELTISTAESLTGGMIASTLVTMPGTSSVVNGGVVSYINQVKHDSLGVSQDTLDTVGPVSESTALQMARGAREALRANVGVSATGIAGPGGEEPGKPVGTVWIAVSSDRGEKAQCLHLSGGRTEVRKQTVDAALKLVLEVLS